MNWALYRVTISNAEIEIEAGEEGCMMTSIKPGIMDAPYGVLLVAPGWWVEQETLGSKKPAAIAAAILKYFREQT